MQKKHLIKFIIHQLQKEIIVKIIFVVFATMLLLTVMACSGGSGDEVSNEENPILSREYDMWEYVASKTDITKNYDMYVTDSKYNPIGEPHLNAGQIKETIINQDSVQYEEFIDGTLVDTESLSIMSSAQISNALLLDGVASYRYIKLFSPLNEKCIFINHYENYSPMSGYNFKDVVQIKYSDYSTFYANGIGKVMAQNHNTVGDGANIIDHYSVKVVNLK